MLVLCGVALLTAALLPAPHAAGSRGPAAVRAVTRPSSSAHRRVLESKVVGSSLPARRYAAVAAAIENGVNGRGRYVSDLSPISWRRVQKPVAEDKRSAERWATRLSGAMRAETARLRSGDRGGARRAWLTAFGDYLRLGAVYGFLPARLNDALAEVPSSNGESRFPGLHMLEKGLWTGRSLHSLVPVARAVERATVRLRRTIPSLWVSSFGYILRAHEIMEDAQRDLLSGAEVPWSGDGVGATAAALGAEREVLRTLAPLLAGRDNTLGVARYWLARMGAALGRVRRPGGGYPALGRLTAAQHALLSSTLAATCDALAAIPGTLELHPLPSIPRDPARR